MKTLPYSEGTCFAVPLRLGGYALGVVARMAPKGKIILVYLFGPKTEVLPKASDFSKIRSADAAKYLITGDLGLLNGEWPIIGDLPNWNADNWPMPSFIRRDELSRRAWRVYFADSDPSRLEREESVPYEIEEFESVSLYGYGAVEVALTKLLC